MTIRKFGAVAAVFAAILATGGLAPAQPVQARQQYEGAALVVGQWRVGGQFDQNGGPVNFGVTLSADGTFVDTDDYKGRWLVSGSSFSMYYPDESELGYAGTIKGGAISGRFRGRDNSGVFRMERGGFRS